MQPMPELERLSTLIEHICRGATEPTLWPDIVAAISEWLGSPKGMLYTPLHGPQQGGLCFQHGRALSAARRLDDVVHFASVVKVPGRASGHDCLLQISRVNLGSSFRAEGLLPQVIVFLTDTRQPAGVDAGLLCRTYGLTPAEARVAVAATARGSVQELADGLELGVNTVKTHLKQVYAKTAVGGRAELVRLVLGLAPVH